MWGLQEALDCRVSFWTPRVGRAFVDTAALGLRVCTISRVLALLEFGCVLGSLYRAHHYGARAKGLFSRPSTKMDTWGFGPIDTRIDTRGFGPPLVALHC